MRLRPHRGDGNGTGRLNLTDPLQDQRPNRVVSCRRRGTRGGRAGGQVPYAYPRPRDLLRVEKEPSLPACPALPARSLRGQTCSSPVTSLGTRSGPGNPSRAPDRPRSRARTGRFLREPRRDRPRIAVKLAQQGKFNAIALHVGLATKYFHDCAGEVSLILKPNGRTNIPSRAEPIRALTGTVEDAVRLGADAVDYSLNVGSPAPDRNFCRITQIRDAADRLGMPELVWVHPRGEAVD